MIRTHLYSLYSLALAISAMALVDRDDLWAALPVGVLAGGLLVATLWAWDRRMIGHPVRGFAWANALTLVAFGFVLGRCL